MGDSRTSLAAPPPAARPAAVPAGALAPPGERRRARELLPALEPERRLDDWGRSERVEAAFDATVAEWLYRYWLRCEVEGIGNVPAEGGTAIVVNHAGPLPVGPLMVAKAIREEHPRPRMLRIQVPASWRRYPGLSMLAAKLGWVPAHPANLERLLADERELVLVPGEGHEGERRTYRERYRLRRFGTGFVETAIRSGASIVPACVVGGEEAAPVLARSRLLGRLLGASELPLTPTFPWLGPLGAVAYLPARLRIRFLPAIDTAPLDPAAAGDRGLVHSLADELRARVQEGLLETLARRRSVWR